MDKACPRSKEGYKGVFQPMWRKVYIINNHPISFLPNCPAKTRESHLPPIFFAFFLINNHTISLLDFIDWFKVRLRGFCSFLWSLLVFFFFSFHFKILHVHFSTPPFRMPIQEKKKETENPLVDGGFSLSPYRFNKTVIHKNKKEKRISVFFLC